MKEKTTDSIVGLVFVISLVVIGTYFIGGISAFTSAFSWVVGTFLSIFTWITTLVISSVIQWIVGAVILVILAVLAQRYFVGAKNESSVKN